MAGISHWLHRMAAGVGVQAQSAEYPKSSSVVFLLVASLSSPGAWISHEVAQGSKGPGSSLL